MYLRLGRGRDPEVYATVPELSFGTAIRLRDGADVAILTTGSEVRPSLDAAALLAADGIEATVFDVHTVKPLDLEAVAAAAALGTVVTVEEHNRTNGLGSAVAVALLEGGFGTVNFRRHGVPDEHVPIGPPAALYAHYQLDADGIAAVVRGTLQRVG